MRAVGRFASPPQIIRLCVLTIPGKTLVCAAAVLGLAVCAFIAWPMRVRAISGINDFVPAYAGARLAFSGKLYNPAELTKVERVETKAWSEFWARYSWLPFYAVMVKPLSVLPYRVAYICWEALSLTAIVAFALLWPVPRWVAVLGCCWAYPLMVCLANGQNDGFLLLLAALAVRAIHRRPALAGSILAFGLIKYHLFLLVPAALVAQRRWRATAGFTATAVVLLAISFAAAGPRWPVEYVAIVQSAKVNPGQDAMPTLHAMLHSTPAVEVIASGLIGLVVLLIASRADFESGVATAMTGGVLIGYHVYTHDCTLVIPAALLALHRTPIPALRLLAAWLLLPLAHVLRYLKLPFSSAYQVTLILFLGLAWVGSRTTKQPLDHDSAAASRGSP